MMGNTTSTERVAVVIVTFNPDGGFAERLQGVLNQVSKVILVDNSTDVEARAWLWALCGRIGERVELIPNERNVGLAIAQNQGIARALEWGVEWVALLDDDSAVPPDMFEHMLKVWESHPQRWETGILAPVVYDRLAAQQNSIMIWRHGFPYRKKISRKLWLGDVVTVIASGSMIRADIIRACGMMREEYFIDWLDIEYCLRIQKDRWRILVVNGAILDHRLGAKSRHAMLGTSFLVSNHAAWRRYTQYRNRMDVWKRYATAFPGYVAYDMLVSFYEMIKIMLFERQRWTKLAACLRGLWDGLLGRFKRT